MESTGKPVVQFPDPSLPTTWREGSGNFQQYKRGKGRGVGTERRRERIQKKRE